MLSQRMMDVSVRQELNSLVEELTHSGAPILSEEPLKKLKRICKYAQAHKSSVEIRSTSFTTRPQSTSLRY